MILFIGVGFGLYALDMSLSSEQGFEALKGAMTSPFGMFVTWGLLTALGYHFIAGIKHLIMDFGVGETIDGSKVAARATLFLSIMVAALAAVLGVSRVEEKDHGHTSYEFLTQWFI